MAPSVPAAQRPGSSNPRVVGAEQGRAQPADAVGSVTFGVAARQ
jgi:hypothetical protein